jgi:hypothetical protein
VKARAIDCLRDRATAHQPLQAEPPTLGIEWFTRERDCTHRNDVCSARCCSDGSGWGWSRCRHRSNVELIVCCCRRLRWHGWRVRGGHCCFSQWRETRCAAVAKPARGRDEHWGTPTRRPRQRVDCGRDCKRILHSHRGCFRRITTVATTCTTVWPCDVSLPRRPLHTSRLWRRGWHRRAMWWGVLVFGRGRVAGSHSLVLVVEGQPVTHRHAPARAEHDRVEKVRETQPLSAFVDGPRGDAGAGAQAVTSCCHGGRHVRARRPNTLPYICSISTPRDCTAECVTRMHHSRHVAWPTHARMTHTPHPLFTPTRHVSHVSLLHVRSHAPPILHRYLLVQLAPSPLRRLVMDTVVRNVAAPTPGLHPGAPPGWMYVRIAAHNQDTKRRCMLILTRRHPSLYLDRHCTALSASECLSERVDVYAFLLPTWPHLTIPRPAST